MDCDASFGGFHEVDELVDDLHGGGAAVHEVEVVNFEAETGEALLFVGWFVKSDDSFNVQSIKQLRVIFRSVQSLTTLII